MPELYDESRNPFAKKEPPNINSDGYDESRNPFSKKSNNPADYPNRISTIKAALDGTPPPHPKEIDENTDWGEVLKTSLSNIPSSSFRLLRDVVNAVTSPIDSAKALYDVAAGGVEKIVPGGENEHVPSFDMLVDHMKNRYGSESGWKKALALDPVGVLSDLSMVVMPSGGAIKTAGKAGKLAGLTKTGEILEDVGSFVTKAGAHADPLTYPGKMVSGSIKNAALSQPGKLTRTSDMIKKAPVVGNILSKTAEGVNSIRDPRKIMENNLNMRGINADGSKKMIDLVMDKELGPTKKSGNILEEMIKAEESKIPELIAENPGKIIETEKFKQFIPENTIDTRFADDRAIQKQTVDDLMNKDGYKVNQITAKEAKSLSNDLNKQFENVKEGQLRGKDEHPVKVNTLDALRRGVSEELINKVAGLKGVNQNMEEFIALKNAIAEATNMVDENTYYKAISLAKTSAINPKAGLLELAKSIVQTPKVKVAYAALLNKIEKTGKVIKPGAQGVGMGLYFPERAKDKDNIQPDIGEE